jgi:hypothetical protein
MREKRGKNGDRGKTGTDGTDPILLSNPAAGSSTKVFHSKINPPIVTHNLY